LASPAISYKNPALEKTYTPEFVWVLALVLSFAYERRVLILTSMDRINPRLFDIVVILGLIFILPRLKKKAPLPKEFAIWTFIVLVFVICALIYSLFLLPAQYANFSLFFAAKYVEGWLAIYIALRIPLTTERKRAIQWAVVAGGVYVGLYSIYQYFFSSGITEIEIAPGKFVYNYGQLLTGPLGYNYIHLAQFSSLCAIMALPLIEAQRSWLGRWLTLVLVLFIGWPLFFSGSRTGLGIFAISFIVGILMVRKVKSRVLGMVLGFGVFFIVIDGPVNMNFLDNSLTFSRFSSSEGTHNSIDSRLGLVFRFNMDQYKWGTIMPLIGGGFYVVPVVEGLYRVGYGIHNNYLFAFEQGGMFALFAFIYLLYASITKLHKITKFGAGVDRGFSIAILAYLLALLPISLVGQTFWLGFGTVNINTFIVLLLMISVMPVAMPKPYLAAPHRAVVS